MVKKIDQWIERLASNTDSFDEETAVKLLCKRIEKTVVLKNKPYQLLITGSVDEDHIVQLFDLLSQRLDSSVFQCIWGGCVCSNLDTLKKAEFCDGIILVEALRKTKDTIMKRQLQILREDMESTILGCILVQ